MTQAVDPVIPLSLMVSRFEKQRDQLRKDVANLKWWQIRRRYILLGAISTYRIEIETALEIGGRTQPLWQKIKDSSQQ